MTLEEQVETRLQTLVRRFGYGRGGGRRRRFEVRHAVRRRRVRGQCNRVDGRGIVIRHCPDTLQVFVRAVLATGPHAVTFRLTPPAVSGTAVSKWHTDRRSSHHIRGKAQKTALTMSRMQAGFS